MYKGRTVEGDCCIYSRDGDRWLYSLQISRNRWLYQYRWYRRTLKGLWGLSQESLPRNPPEHEQHLSCSPISQDHSRFSHLSHWRISSLNALKANKAQYTAKSPHRFCVLELCITVQIIKQSLRWPTSLCACWGWLRYFFIQFFH